jgi:hypothetical protein
MNAVAGSTILIISSGIILGVVLIGRVATTKRLRNAAVGCLAFLAALLTSWLLLTPGLMFEARTRSPEYVRGVQEVAGVMAACGLLLFLVSLGLSILAWRDDERPTRTGERRPADA